MQIYLNSLYFIWKFGLWDKTWCTDFLQSNLGWWHEPNKIWNDLIIIEFGLSVLEVYCIIPLLENFILEIFYNKVWKYWKWAMKILSGYSLGILVPSVQSLWEIPSPFISKSFLCQSWLTTISGKYLVSCESYLRWFDSLSHPSALTLWVSQRCLRNSIPRTP